MLHIKFNHTIFHIVLSTFRVYLKLLCVKYEYYRKLPNSYVLINYYKNDQIKRICVSINQNNLILLVKK